MQRATLHAVVLWLSLMSWASAKPLGPSLFCEANPDSPSCAGTAIACDYCHGAQPPSMNPFGNCFTKNLIDRSALFPSDKDQMVEAMGAIAALDCDVEGC